MAGILPTQSGTCLYRCMTGTWTLQSGAPTSISTQVLVGSPVCLSTKDGMLPKSQSKDTILPFNSVPELYYLFSFLLGSLFFFSFQICRLVGP